MVVFYHIKKTLGQTLKNQWRV